MVVHFVKARIGGGGAALARAGPDESGHYEPAAGWFVECVVTWPRYSGVDVIYLWVKTYEVE
jgi:hypothetical protein